MNIFSNYIRLFNLLYSLLKEYGDWFLKFPSIPAHTKDTHDLGGLGVGENSPADSFVPDTIEAFLHHFLCYC